MHREQCSFILMPSKNQKREIEVSVVITSYKEPTTIGNAIAAVIPQLALLSLESELLVVAPDRETLRVAETYKTGFGELRTIQDQGRGKSAALNLAKEYVRGKLLILSDGDVVVAKTAISELLVPFKDERVGAVSGNPVSINSRKKKYGFWSHVLTETAHERRKKSRVLRKRFFCSGYLFAIRKELFPKLFENLLSEDGFISHRVYEQGYVIAYAERAKVYVKFPTNFKDWINQKLRSAGGYNQIKDMLNVEMRSFKKESLGSLDVLRYPNRLREIVWLVELFLARLYLWHLIYRDVTIKKKSREELWKRIESTK